MRLNEILTESQDLEEGPLDAIGRGAAKVIGGVAKGAGMLGGIAGGVKKAYQKGKDISTSRISGEELPEPEQSRSAAQQTPADPYASKQSAPAAPSAAPTAADVNAQGPKGTAPAKTQTGAAGQAAAKTAAAMGSQDTEKAGQTMYAQVKANISKLDKKGKQRIMQLLQKSLAAPAPQAAAAPAAPVQKAAPARNKPVKVKGKAPAAVPAANVQTQSKINSGNIIAEGFTFFRKK